MIETKGLFEKSEEMIRYLNSDIDLFISGISLEERCSIGWMLIKKQHINIKHKIILYFEEVVNAARQQYENPEQYFDNLFDIHPIDDAKVHIKIYEELDGLIEFEKQLNTIFQESDPKEIVIDFSVMVKPYMFILLKYFLYAKNIEKIYLIYTEPESYLKTKEKMIQMDGPFFTNGSIETRDIPSYSGTNNLAKKTALVVLLGFEGIKTSEVVRAIEPEITIPVNGFPSYKPEFKDISIISNEDILREDEIFRELKYAPANDPFETKDVLDCIYKKYADKYNISVAPLGTKPMALGSCLFALKHSDSRVVYPYPLKYNLKSSEGYGHTWLYLISSLDG